MTHILRKSMAEDWSGYSMVHGHSVDPKVRPGAPNGTVGVYTQNGCHVGKYFERRCGMHLF